ncbi:hypothetical protein J4573_02240 [Actinomadura barringtoniae]|uniref:Xaa-Pro dipeptidyl-peptidase C-terminal domain-containing protein n=1 Tax=Actinomadura barringtoniae TaxID=1427535 RepID=A0A939T241_9ACTN|nr:hypothetical protein [Actinomadura barringtoniae]
MVRLRFPPERPGPVEPESPQSISVESSPSRYLFAAGHRLQVQVSSSRCKASGGDDQACVRQCSSCALGRTMRFALHRIWVAILTAGGATLAASRDTMQDASHPPPCEGIVERQLHNVAACHGGIRRGDLCPRRKPGAADGVIC